jgi:hypothetical protein
MTRAMKLRDEKSRRSGERVSVVAGEESFDVISRVPEFFRHDERCDDYHPASADADEDCRKVT